MSVGHGNNNQRFSGTLRIKNGQLVSYSKYPREGGGGGGVKCQNVLEKVWYKGARSCDMITFFNLQLKPTVCAKA